VRVVVTGATGNVGTSVLDALEADHSIKEIIGVARRLPTKVVRNTQFISADVARDDLDPIFRGADAIVHLAWIIQPARRRKERWFNNVDGTRRVLESAARVGVRSFVHASSVGAYSAAPKTRIVDERWPTGGIPQSEYSREKAAVERILDNFEADHPSIRVVRLRPALIFKRTAAAGIRKLFVGPLAPNALFRHPLVIPDVPRLKFQCVHSHDVGEAYRLAVTGDARGPFNIAANPILDAKTMAEALDTRRLRVPELLLRAGARVGFGLGLVRAGPEWVELALKAPLMDCSHAERELGWVPRVSATEALRELMRGLAEDDGMPTPPLEPRHGRMQTREMP
jgi:nucleoside-diphosphate-sugar epimerase